MVAVVLGSMMSFGVALFALAVVLREFQARWPQVVAALAGTETDDPVTSAAQVRRLAAPRQMWPAPVRVQPSRRAAA